MSLYSYKFQSLPRPPRSIFSHGNEDTRARLPDFTTVAELSQFLHRLFVYKIDMPGYFVQTKLCAGIVALFLIGVLLIVARRMYESSFWLVRLEQRSTGRVIVPNALLCFSLVEGVYACFFIAFLLEQSKWYESHKHSPISSPFLICTLWVPLITGPIVASWGTYFATPRRPQPGPRGGCKANSVRRYFGRAVVINCMGILGPCIVLLTVAVPGIKANVEYIRIYHRAQAWQKTFGQLDAFTPEMVQEAQAVWYALILSSKTFSTTFFFWVSYAALICIIYSTLSWRLISVIRAEVETMKDPSKPPCIAVATYVATDDEESSVARELVGFNVEDEENKRMCPSQRSPMIPPPLPNCANGIRFAVLPADRQIQSCQTGGDARGDARGAKTAAVYKQSFPQVTGSTDYSSYQREGAHYALPNEGAIAASSNRHGQQRGLMDTLRSHMPALTPLRVPRTSIVQSSRQKEAKQLQQALGLLIIQAMSIGPACLVFMAAAIFLCTTAHDGLEQPREGGIWMEVYEPIYVLIVSWATVFFGYINMLAIAKRTYEPVFNPVRQSTGIAIDNH